MSEILESLPAGVGLNTPGVYTILTGESQKKYYQKESRHTGVITAPADFFLKKHTDTTASSDQFMYYDMLLTYSMKDGKITYIENNSTDESCAVIIGEIIINDELRSLNINKNHKYTSQQLADLLKFNRRLFADADECMALVTNLKNFTADISQRIEAIDDKQGTKVHSYMHKVAHEVRLSFVLNTVIITGSDQLKKFKVDILFDLRDKAVEFWLESVELKEIIDDTKSIIIKEQLDRFDNYIPVIQLS